MCLVFVKRFQPAVMVVKGDTNHVNGNAVSDSQNYIIVVQITEQSFKLERLRKLSIPNIKKAKNKNKTNTHIKQLSGV